MKKMFLLVLIALVFISTASFVNGACTEMDAHDSGQDWDAPLGYGLDQWSNRICTQFTTTSAYSFDMLNFSLKSASGVTGVMEYSIYSDSATKPSTQLARAEGNFNAITTDYTWVGVGFTDYALSTATNYWVCISMYNETSHNTALWDIGPNGVGYTKGWYSGDWLANSVRQSYFKIYSDCYTAPVIPSINFSSFSPSGGSSARSPVTISGTANFSVNYNNCSLYLNTSSSILGLNLTNTNYYNGTNVPVNFSLNLSGGTWYYTVNCSNVDYANGVSLNNFTADNIPPYIKIDSPTSSNYTTPNIAITFTSDVTNQTIWWSNGTTNNITYVPGNSYDFRNGTYTITAYANDSIGNINTTSVIFTVDMIPPYINITSPSNFTYNTKDITVELISDETSQTIWWSNNSYNNVTYVSPLSYVFINGSYTIVAYANDSFGNTNITPIIIFTVDMIPPYVAINSPQSIFYDTTTISVDIISDVTNSTLWWSNGTYNNITYVPGSSYEFSEGGHDIYAYANDSLGNLNKSALMNFSVDTIEPYVYITYPPNGMLSTDYDLNVNFTVTDTNLYSCWWTDDAGITNHSQATCGNLSGAWLSGLNTVTIFANDSANNVNSSTVAFTIDTFAPYVRINSPVNNNHYYGVIDIKATIFDSLTGINSSHYNITNSTSIIVSKGSLNNTLDTVPLADGNYSLIVWANDSLGNTNQSVISFHIDNHNVSINWINPSGNILTGITSHVLDIRVNDLYLDAVNLTLYNSTNGILYNNDTSGIIVSSFNFSDTIELSQGDQAYTFEVCARDSLTSSPIIKDTQYSMDKVGINLAREVDTLRYVSSDGKGATINREIRVIDEKGDKTKLPDYNVTIVDSWDAEGKHIKTDIISNKLQTEKIGFVLSYTCGSSCSKLEILRDRGVTRVVDDARSMYFNFDDVDSKIWTVTYFQVGNSVDVKIYPISKTAWLSLPSRFTIDPIAGGLNNICENKTLTLSIVPRYIRLDSPLNTTYPTTTILINITSEPTNDTIWWQNDSYNNVTYIAPAYYEFTKEGHTITAYVNDSLLSINTTQVIFNIDAVAPTFTFIPDNVTMIYKDGFIVNFTAVDDMFSIDSYFINWTDTFEINSSGWLENSTANIPVGEYIVLVSANDTGGNTVSAVFKLNVDRAGNAIDITSSAGWSLTYPTSTTLQATSTFGTPELYKNGTSLTNPFTDTLPAGDHNISANISESDNYLANMSYKILSIAQGVSMCIISSNSPITYPANLQVNASCTNPEGTITLFRNGTDVTSTNGTFISLTAGDYSYKVNVTNSENYTSNESETIVVSISKGSPSLTLYSSGGWALDYLTGSHVNGTEEDQGDSDLSYELYRNGTVVSNPDIQSLGAGAYLYDYNTTGGENWTSANSTNVLVINRISPSGYMSVAGTSPITYSSSSDWEGTETATGDGDCTYELYANTTLVSNPDNTIYSAGLVVYNYTTEGCVNYTAGSVTDNLVITQFPGDVLLRLNGVHSNLTYVYETTVNVSAYSQNGSILITYDGIDITALNNQDLTFGGGFHTIEVTASGVNYTIATDLLTVNITNATPSLNLTFNFSVSNYSSGNMTVESGTTVTFTGWLLHGVGQIRLWLNNVLQAIGDSPIWENFQFLTPGSNNITVTYDGNENFSSSYMTWWINVEDTTPPWYTNFNVTADDNYKKWTNFTINITAHDITNLTYIIIESNFSGTPTNYTTDLTLVGGTEYNLSRSFNITGASRGQTFQYRVWIIDIGNNGNYTPLYEETVTNAPPIISNLVAHPTIRNETVENFSITYSYFDVDNDTDLSLINWSVDGAEVQYTTSWNFSHVGGYVGNTVFNITAFSYDGYDYGNNLTTGFLITFNLPVISTLTPTAGSFSTVVPIDCIASGTGNYYTLTAYYNDGSSTAWRDLITNSSSYHYDWFIANLPAQSGVDLACYVYNVAGNASLNPAGTISFNSDYVFDLVTTLRSNPIEKTTMMVGVKCDLKDNTDYNIKMVWGDCDNDGIWDFARNFTTNKTETLDWFKCKYENPQTYLITGGCILEKYGAGEWDPGLCTIERNYKYCKREIQYPVEVIANEYHS